MLNKLNKFLIVSLLFIFQFKQKAFFDDSKNSVEKILINENGLIENDDHLFNKNDFELVFTSIYVENELTCKVTLELNKLSVFIKNGEDLEKNSHRILKNGEEFAWINEYDSKFILFESDDKQICKKSKFQTIKGFDGIVKMIKVLEKKMKKVNGIEDIKINFFKYEGKDLDFIDFMNSMRKNNYFDYKTDSSIIEDLFKKAEEKMKKKIEWTKFNLILDEFRDKLSEIIQEFCLNQAKIDEENNKNIFQKIFDYFLSFFKKIDIPDESKDLRKNIFLDQIDYFCKIDKKSTKKYKIKIPDELEINMEKSLENYFFDFKMFNRFISNDLFEKSSENPIFFVFKNEYTLGKINSENISIPEAISLLFKLCKHNRKPLKRIKISESAEYIAVFKFLKNEIQNIRNKAYDKYTLKSKTKTSLNIQIRELSKEYNDRVKNLMVEFFDWKSFLQEEFYEKIKHKLIPIYEKAEFFTKFGAMDAEKRINVKEFQKLLFMAGLYSQYKYDGIRKTLPYLSDIYKQSLKANEKFILI